MHADLRELETQLSELKIAILEAKNSEDQTSYQLLTYIYRLLVFSIQLKNGTLNTREKINKVWSTLENSDTMIPEEVSGIDKANFLKSFLYDLFAIIYGQYHSQPSIQPKTLLEQLDIKALSSEENTDIEKYQDPLSKCDIEFPICITEQHNNQYHDYYFDLKTMMCSCISKIMPANMQIKDINDRPLAELFPLLQFALQETADIPNLQLINPLTSHPITLDSINLVDEDYLVALQQLQTKYPLMVEPESNIHLGYRP